MLDPGQNRYRLDMLNVSYHSPMMRVAPSRHLHVRKRLSHTADSQDQRHRMVPASRPLMTFADTTAPDYVMPRLIAANPQALAVYRVGDAGRLGCEEPAARARRAARVRALRAAERQRRCG